MPSLVDPTKPADGVPVQKADLRDAFARIRAELDHGGFWRPTPASPAIQTVEERLRELGGAADPVARLSGVALLNISADLPFAAGRFCESNGLKNVVALSTFRSPDFAQAYGVKIVNGPLAGLTARAVVVLDVQDRVLYTEQVPEIAREPNYEAALAAVR